MSALISMSADREHKHEHQSGDVKPQIPVGGGLEGAPSGENIHGYADLLIAGMPSLVESRGIPEIVETKK